MQFRQLATVLAAAAIIVGAPLAANAAAPAGKPAAAAAASKGPELFAKNGCIACHGLVAKDAKKMGPNFSAVADKYPNTPANVDKLAKKIRAGGKGSFGQIPMPPMAQVSEADAKELAKFALAHKGK